MTRQEFLKLFKLGAYAFAASSLKLDKIYSKNDDGFANNKNWIWFHLWRNASEDDYKRNLEKLKLSGINCLLPNIYASWKAAYNSKHLPISEPLLEKLLPIAKSMDMEVHGWMWTMICNNEDILEKHPDWFAVNRNGESTVTHPAYVNYYRFMCPNNPEVQNFIAATVAELSEYELLTGVHLDYVRYPDVILAENLQKKYNIVQDKEYPEYDYCYCNICRDKFKNISGIDITKSMAPEYNKMWREFRYNSMNDLVNNHLVPEARKRNKKITAAVFPNWENVRQQWMKWNLDAVMPMLYQEFYNEGDDWIVHHIEKGKTMLNPSTKLYSGLLVGSFNVEELAKIIKKSYEAKADGIALFAYHGLNEEHWTALEKLNKEFFTNN